MSTFFVDAAMSAALWIVIKASVLLAIAAVVLASLRRRASADIRHLAWTVAIVGLLLLPMLSLALPGWPVVLRTTTNTAVVPMAITGVQEQADAGRSAALFGPTADPVLFVQSARGVSGSTLIATVYAAGVLVMLMPLVMQWRNVRRLAREASEVQDLEWTRLFDECAGQMGVHRPVRLLRSRRHSMPMAWGTCRPAVLIPAIGETWAENRRRAVILHELAHVARYDCLTQTLACVARAMYWFHPAAWWVARRLRIERELACDDRVIAAGTQGREYASHLLDIAYAVGNQRAPALAVSMARPCQLERRMLAALDAARNRSVAALRVRVAGAAIAAALLSSLAAARPTIAAAERDSEHAPAAASASAARPQGPAPALPLELEERLREVARHMTRVAAASGIGQDQLPGTWEIRPTSTAGTVHLRLLEVNSSSGTNIPLDELDGLTAAQLAGAGGPVQFRLRRDAGTFTFEGVLRNGVGAGTFSFTPDPSFPAELAKRGLARPTAREQYQMARHDVGYALVDELNTQGYSKPQTSELVRAGQHGVQVTYVREMGGLGYRLGSLEPLITLRDHGVTPGYVRELAEQGYKGLSADELRRARDHGVTPQYVRDMREAGYTSLPMDALVEARDHGVTPQFVRELGDAGHRTLPLDQLIRVRDHGVSPAYVRELRELGHGLPIDELVRARDHGVDVQFVRDMAALGYGSLPMESLVRLRDHGVTATYVQELKTLGYDRVPMEDLVTLRDHGLTPDRIRAANARAGTRLPIDMLKSLAAGGMR
jgi:beta-lactamase regulating signal transducer with metallopeptidase domain